MCARVDRDASTTVGSTWLLIRRQEQGAKERGKKWKGEDWSEWTKMNLDTGVAVNKHFLGAWVWRGTGDGRFYRTASGESIPDVTVCFDLRTEDLWVCAKYCVVLQRSRAKDDKFFCMRHDGGFRIPVLEGRQVVDHIELLEEEEREGTFLSLVKTGATCCERKGATVYSISFLVGFMCFSQILVRQRIVIQTWSKDVAQRGEGHPSRSTKKFVANVLHDEAPKVPWEHVSLFHQELWGDMVHKCDKKIEKSTRRR